MKGFKSLSLAVLASCVMTFSAVAKDKKDKKEDGYVFTEVKTIPNTSIKNQHRSGTCWSFSGISFLESEMMRMGKEEVDLSEMFIVYHCYSDKAEKFVRLHGKLNFGPGGAFHDVTYVLKNYGLVPENAYTGLNIGEKNHVHGEMDQILNDMVSGVIKNKNRKISPVWRNAFDATLDTYLGELPKTFEYKGKEYTPKTFAKEVTGLNADDYVEISSYTHHPFYSQFAIEVPDNWLWDNVYNVPMNEMMEIIDNAINKGYSVAWAADVSEKGFDTKKKGVAIVPEADLAEMDNAEIAKWENMSDREKQSKLLSRKGPGKEKKITQEMRQEAYDNYQTTDDHGMQIVGTAKDQKGNMYYKVKNSWGEYNDYKGYFYASKPFVEYKTMDIMVHKSAIPKHIRKKLGL
ncbi:aminopeptidase [Prolixibacteraceae bacterium JC049]|nr:aminopeptidase [Prolixibacteraceae bacterium JC049]